jgi:hypothetical protein
MSFLEGCDDFELFLSIPKVGDRWWIYFWLQDIMVLGGLGVGTRSKQRIILISK